MSHRKAGGSFEIVYIIAKTYISLIDSKFPWTASQANRVFPLKVALYGRSSYFITPGKRTLIHPLPSSLNYLSLCKAVLFCRSRLSLTHTTKHSSLNKEVMNITPRYTSAHLDPSIISSHQPFLTSQFLIPPRPNTRNVS